MVARRRVLTDLSGFELRAAAIATSATLVITLAALHKFGAKGLLAPVGVALVIAMLLRPVAAIAGTVLVTVLAEGPTFGLFSFTRHLYDNLFKGLSPLDVLVALCVLSVAFDLLRRHKPIRVPRPLALPLMCLALGMVMGIVMGHTGGSSIAKVVLAEDVLGFLLVLPIAIASLDVERRTVERLLGAALGLALFKAILGLVEIVIGHGVQIEGTARLTYYEPAPNWVISIAILTLFAAIVGRSKLKRWMVLAFPLLVACLLLSYRRSFWVALVLALLLVLLIGMAPSGRKLLVPAALLVVAAVWLLSSIHISDQGPIAKRVTSLNPNSLQTNLDDRYRIDERANVLGEIRQHPISGLGMTIPWAATVRPLPVEHENGRQYVHFAALWWWLKLGILGLAGYIGLIVGSLWMSFQAWRRSSEPLLRAFALASMCGIAGLVVLDTTASFTGVDPRFTVVFGAQLGVLWLLASTGDRREEEARRAAPAPHTGAAPLELVR